MPLPLLIFCQSDYLIRITAIIHILNGKQCRSRSVGFFRSQLIWIYTVCKDRVYPGSAGQGLRWSMSRKNVYWGMWGKRSHRSASTIVLTTSLNYTVSTDSKGPSLKRLLVCIRYKSSGKFYLKSEKYRSRHSAYLELWV